MNEMVKERKAEQKQRQKEATTKNTGKEKREHTGKKGTQK